MITRIRLDNEVVGYKREEANYVFFSKDLYGWNGKEIDYNQEEKSTAYKDKNAKLIFENDVLEIKNKKEDSGHLYYIQFSNEELTLKAYNNGDSLKISTLLSNEYSIKKIGFLEKID